MKNSYPALDGVRGIAAAAVAIWHWFSMARLTDPWFIAINAVLYRSSEIAVTTFFVLSGTVLTLSIIRSESENELTMLFRYYIRRAFRIMPLVIFVVSFAFIWMYVLRTSFGIEAPWKRYSDFTFESWFLSITLLDSEFNPPGWTLKLEVVAYILLPFLVLSIIRVGIVRFICFLLFIVLTFTFIKILTFQVFFELMPMFIPGIILAFYILPPPGDHKLSHMYLIVGVIGLGLLVEIEKVHYDLSFLISVACSSLVAYSVLSKGRFKYFIESKPFRILGQISYGVYLWHYPILFSLYYIFGSYVGTKSLPVFLAVGFVGLPLTIAVAALSFNYFEKPMMGFAAFIARNISLPIKKGETLI